MGSARVPWAPTGSTEAKIHTPMVIERARRDDTYVPNREIELHLWGSNLPKMSRTTRDVIRDLRDAIAGDAANASELRALIETRTNLGYRLALKPEEIELED